MLDKTLLAVSSANNNQDCPYTVDNIISLLKYILILETYSYVYIKTMNPSLCASTFSAVFNGEKDELVIRSLLDDLAGIEQHLLPAD